MKVALGKYKVVQIQHYQREIRMKVTRKFCQANKAADVLNNEGCIKQGYKELFNNFLPLVPYVKAARADLGIPVN